MKSKVVLELGSESHVKSRCEKLSIPYRHLVKSQEIPELELFRIHKYIENYDQILFLPKGLHPENIGQMFKSHQGGKLGKYRDECFLADKSSLKAFEPPKNELTRSQCISCILDKSPDTYDLQIETRNVGSELKSIFKYIGFPTCGACSRLSLEMNAKGIDWIEENYDQVVQKITQNAKKLGNRGGRLMDYGISKILDIAIRKAKKETGLLDETTLIAAKTFISIKNKISGDK